MILAPDVSESTRRRRPGATGASHGPVRMEGVNVRLAEVDPALARRLADSLAREAFVVSPWAPADPVGEGDVVVLGAIAGWPEVCRRLRRDHPAIRIVVLAARADAVTALETGADDVLPREALSLRELALRLRAVRRRHGVALEEPGTIEVGPFVVDTVDQTVAVEGRLVDVAPAELRVLAVLARSPGRVVDRETLMLRAWGDERLAKRTVDSAVKRLRARLGPAGRLIGTVRGVGYRLDA